MYNFILFSIMILVFVSYNVTILFKYGQLESISVSYYSLPDKWKPMFTLFCFGYALPAVFMATTGLMFFAGGFICFVGVAAAFRQDDFVSKIHTYSAFTAVLLSQLSVLFDYKLYWVNIMFTIIGLILYLSRNKFRFWMYYLEVLAFICIGIILFKQIKF